MKRPRTVFGRQRFEHQGKTWIVEMRTGELVVHRLHQRRSKRKWISLGRVIGMNGDNELL